MADPRDIRFVKRSRSSDSSVKVNAKKSLAKDTSVSPGRASLQWNILTDKSRKIPHLEIPIVSDVLRASDC